METLWSRSWLRKSSQFLQRSWIWDFKNLQSNRNFCHFRAVNNPSPRKAVPNNFLLQINSGWLRASSAIYFKSFSLIYTYNKCCCEAMKRSAIVSTAKENSCNLGNSLNWKCSPNFCRKSSEVKFYSKKFKNWKKNSNNPLTNFYQNMFLFCRDG